MVRKLLAVLVLLALPALGLLALSPLGLDFVLPLGLALASVFLPPVLVLAFG
jgi:hypothetical protein